MRRRELIFLLGGAMTAAHALGAQQKAMPVIGYLSGASPGPYAPFVAAFHRGLTETGYVEEQTWRSSTAGRRVAMIECPHWPPTSSAARSM
jgi:hypothetical protein